MSDGPATSLIHQSVLPQEADSSLMLDALLEEIRGRFGDGLAAVLVYGSYIRGKRDTLVDFYILLDNHHAFTRRKDRWSSRALPPSVFQIQAVMPSEKARAKCATMTLSQFENCVRTDFHSYFWARFAQPSRLVYVKSDAVRDRVVASIQSAAAVLVRRVAPRLGARFTALELWSVGFRHTYRCEFRVEQPDYINALVEADGPYYEGLTAALAAMDSPPLIKLDADSYGVELTGMQRRANAVGWLVRRWQGKLLSILRLAKAATTFEAPLDYILWKIERHSGLVIEPTPRQRRYPLIFGWGLLWRAYRQGAVR